MSVAHQTRRSPNRTFNSEAIQRNGGESTTVPPENEGFTKKQKKIIASIAISSLLAGGVIADKIFGKAETVPVHPNAAVADTVNPGETQKEPAIPNEAKQFVSEVGSRYADPVSTYYAVEAYKKEHSGKTPVLSDEFINNYDNSGPRDMDLSTLGFTAYRLPLDAVVNQKTLIDIFNNYTKPNLDLYMNLLSKNPSAKAVTIIDSEFRDYCSDGGSFKEDDNGIAALMATAKKEVAEHGNATIFKTAKASENPNNLDATLYPGADTTTLGTFSWGGQNIKCYTSAGINLVIDSDEYNNKLVNHVKKTTRGIVLSVMRQPTTGDDKYSFISIGQEL